MKARLRAAAARDVSTAFARYARLASQAIADAFLDEVGRAVKRVEQHPLSGSPRLGRELGLPGIRTMLVRRFPFELFYRVTSEGVDVVRVLHQRRNARRHVR